MIGLLLLTAQAAVPPDCASFARAPDALAGSLDQAIRRRTASPEAWERCVTSAWPLLAPQEDDALLAAIGDALIELLAGRPTPPRVAWVTAVARALGGRPADRPVPTLRARALAAERRDLASGYADGVRQVQRAVEPATGTWEGRPVDAGAVDAATDVALLERFAQGLPDDDLRRRATERALLLRASASDDAFVREHATEAARAVADHGRWAVDAVAVRWTVEPRPQLALSQPIAGARLTPVELDLSQVLAFRVDGLERELSLCPADDPLEPCVDGPVRSDDGGLRDGRLSVGGAVGPERLWALALSRTLDVRVSVGPLTTEALSLPVRLDAPPALVWSGPEGGTGPALAVVVEPGPTPETTAVKVRVDGGSERLFVVPDWSTGFAVVSSGGEGRSGVRGTHGRNGVWVPGTVTPSPLVAAGVTPAALGPPPAVTPPAILPGGSGSIGGSGGPGGPGGVVRAVVRCSEPVRCAQMEALARRWMRSAGGAGGPGGAGGTGGALGGGAGAGGNAGPAGAPGPVTITSEAIP